MTVAIGNLNKLNHSQILIKYFKMEFSGLHIFKKHDSMTFHGDGVKSILFKKIKKIRLCKLKVGKECNQQSGKEKCFSYCVSSILNS